MATTSTPPNITELLARTNIDSVGFRWFGVAKNKKKRWNLPVPVKTNGVKRAEEALGRIEVRLKKGIFDRCSIAGIDNDRIQRGLIISEMTATAPRLDRNVCGNVSSAPFETDYPKNFLNEETGVISAVLYVNLGSILCNDSERGCAKSDIAVHEFGHALGLGEHFPGFGEDDIISEVFWLVLAELYK
jgi:hypothetical protein